MVKLADNIFFQITAEPCFGNFTANYSINLRNSMTNLEIFQFAYNISLAYRYISLVLAPINVLLNYFSYYIFLDAKWNCSIISRILKYLSIAEVVFNLSILLREVLPNTESIGIQYVNVFLFTMSFKLLSIIQVSALMSRNWTIMLLAAYRYESICANSMVSHKHSSLKIKQRKVFQPSRICLVFSCIYAALFLIATPRAFERTLSFSKCSKGHMSKFNFLLAKYPIYIYFYLSFFVFVVQTGAPILVVCILSVFVLQVIQKMRNFRQQQGIPSTRQPSGDRLIMVMCVIFFLLEMPSFFSKILEHLLEKLSRTNQVLGLIGNLCVMLDSMTNLFIYIYSNPTFVRIFKRKIAYLSFSLGLSDRPCDMTLGDDQTRMCTVTMVNEAKLSKFSGGPTKTNTDQLIISNKSNNQLEEFEVELNHI